MKRLIYFLGILSGILLCSSACDKNNIKKFGAGDANVYFPASRQAVAVGNTVSVPVNLANLKGAGEIVVELKFSDSTAVEGVDYEVLTGKKCVFKAGVGTEYIVIEALQKKDDDVAKRILEIEVITPAGLRDNVNNKTIVEIQNYSKHPLKNLLGEATFMGVELIQDNALIELPVSIYPDDSEELTIWLSGLSGGVYGGTIPDIQLLVDTVRKEITMPYQSFASVRLNGVSGNIETAKGEVIDNIVYLVPRSSITLKYNNEGEIFFQDWFGMEWTSGSAIDELLFLYYGFFGGQYNTMIVRND